MENLSPEQHADQTSIFEPREKRDTILSYVEADLARFRAKFFEKNAMAQLDTLHTLAVDLGRLEIPDDPEHPELRPEREAEQATIRAIADEIYPRQMSEESMLANKKATKPEEFQKKIEGWLNQLLTYLAKVAPEHTYAPEQFILDRRKQAYLAEGKDT